MTPQVIDDISVAHQFSNNDYDLEQKVFSALKQAVAMDDKALEKAGGQRPAAVVTTVLPEDALGLTLDQVEAPYKALIGQWQNERPMTSGKTIEGSPSAGGTDISSATSTNPLDMLGGSTASTEPATSTSSSSIQEVAGPG